MIDLKLTMQIFFGFLALWMLGSYILDATRRKRVAKRLADRPQYSDLKFAEHAFAGNPAKMQLADRVHMVLEKHLDIALEGLRLDDKLADIELAVDANPDFFFDLENEFDVKTRIDEYEVYEKLVVQLVTVADVIDYVEVLIATAKRRKKGKHRWGWNAASFDRLVETSVPFLCVSGFALIVPGGIFRVAWMLRLGTFLFLLGFAVFFFSFVGALTWNFASTYRETGSKPFRENWLTSLVFFLWGAGFLYCGLVIGRMLIGIFTEDIPWM